MRTGNLIVFGPGFRQVWKFKFDAMPLLLLVVTLGLSLLVMSTVGYFAPLLTEGRNANSSRLVVENGTLTIENRAAQAQLDRLAERARRLEQQTSRMEAELSE
jgi:hypothetical protein